MQSLREFLAPPPAPTLAEDILDDYLDHLSVGLAPLPPSVRAEIRHEVGEHLRSAAAQREEAGMAPVAAARDAALRFGAPEKIAARFVRVWEAAGKIVTPWQTVVTALVAVPLAALIVALLPAAASGAPGQTVAAVAGVVVGAAAPTRPTLRLRGVLAWAVGAAVAGVAAVAVLPQIDLVFAFGDIGLRLRLEAIAQTLLLVAPPSAAVTAVGIRLALRSRGRRQSC